MKRGALIDIDGLLVDTERLGVKIFMKILANNGIKISLKKAEEYFIGHQDAESYRLACQEQGLDEKKTEELLAEHTKEYNKAIKGIDLMKGARELLEMMKRLGYRMAVVSSSFKDQIKTITDHNNITEYFDDILTCDTPNIRRKPFPDIYREAAKRLGIPINQCLVFEDSRQGVIGGKRAGAYTIGVQDHPSQDLSRADMIVKSLTELVEREEFFKKFGME